MKHSSVKNSSVKHSSVKHSSVKNSSVKHWDHQVDATHLKCPMPLLKMKQALNNAKVGEIILVKVTDPGSQRDFQSYIKMTSHQLELVLEDNCYCYWITKF